MKIRIIGGGPAGLYFSILVKKNAPSADIEVWERHKRGSTFGWGVVFSDETVKGFLSADEESSEQILGSLYHWDDIDVHYKGTTTRSTGHGFSGISRQKLLDILTARAESLGVSVLFEQNVECSPEEVDADLVVAADGIFSKTRGQLSDQFKPNVDWRKCKYVWLGTEKLFDAFTFAFKETEYGWFQAHAYRFDENTLINTLSLKNPNLLL